VLVVVAHKDYLVLPDRLGLLDRKESVDLLGRLDLLDLLGRLAL
jgi:hypothetical protein